MTHDSSSLMTHHHSCLMTHDSSSLMSCYSFSSPSLAPFFLKVCNASASINATASLKKILFPMYPASAIDVSTAQHHVSKNRGWGFQNFSLANYGNRIHNYIGGTLTLGIHDLILGPTSVPPISLVIVSLHTVLWVKKMV